MNEFDVSMHANEMVLPKSDEFAYTSVTDSTLLYELAFDLIAVSFATD